MAKLTFHANFLKITNVYEKQKEANVKQKVTIANTKQQDGTGVPPMPRMVFNRDGSPCHAHLEKAPPRETKQVKGEGGVEYFIAPRINWKED